MVTLPSGVPQTALTLTLRWVLAASTMTEAVLKNLNLRAGPPELGRSGVYGALESFRTTPSSPLDWIRSNIAAFSFSVRAVGTSRIAGNSGERSRSPDNRIQRSSYAQSGILVAPGIRSKAQTVSP